MCQVAGVELEGGITVGQSRMGFRGALGGLPGRSQHPILPLPPKTPCPPFPRFKQLLKDCFLGDKGVSELTRTHNVPGTQGWVVHTSWQPWRNHQSLTSALTWQVAHSASLGPEPRFWGLPHGSLLLPGFLAQPSCPFSPGSLP